MKHARFPGRLILVGFGSVGQGILPLILRHFEIGPDRIEIIAADEDGSDLARAAGVRFTKLALTRENYREELGSRLSAGDFLLNLSVDVASAALIEFCHEIGVLYLDTCIEPWAGLYFDPTLSPAARSNYALREEALALGRRLGKGPTAVVAHGANPGLVSHFVKEALLNIARDTGTEVAAPTTREEWAALAKRLGIRAIHIAERDTQRSAKAKEIGEFVNTWSVDGFISEGCQPAELGWGTHERHWPEGAQAHEAGCRSAIMLGRPGAATRVRTWTPIEGPFHGFLITHNEAISLADFLTVRKDGEVTYRPTVHYAYHPCDDAVLSLHEFAGKNWKQQERKRILMDEIVPGGIDELGVLLMGHAKGAYWYGSQLSIDEARELAPHNNATSLQVAAGVLGAMVWAIENPEQGVVEPETLDHKRVLAVANPYLGPMTGAYSDWTPLAGRGELFAEAVDAEDPWQFHNIIVR